LAVRMDGNKREKRKRKIGFHSKFLFPFSLSLQISTFLYRVPTKASFPIFPRSAVSLIFDERVILLHVHVGEGFGGIGVG
jgi:hypothetical protein